jgi:shikimate dehydrogenase
MGMSSHRSDKKILDLRELIDAIDEEMLHLINRRLGIASQIGRIKSRKGTKVIDPERESSLIQRLNALNKGPLSKENLYHIFREIITVSREIQAPHLSEFLGPGSTAVYAVIGDPISHSLSPVMHNRAFAHIGHNGVYVPFRVTDIQAAVTGIRGLGIKGASITIPHKVSVIKYLDEIDPKALKIGAVNTIVNRKGHLVGYNSDYLGAVKALTKQTNIKDQTVVIVGAGGAARAIGFGVLHAGGKVIILNRSSDKGQRLADDLGAEFKPLSECRRIVGQIIVNTTPVGMFPHAEEMPIPKDLLTPDLTVMDIIYNPLRTRLLTEAQDLGCKTIGGLAMFVYQGAFQFELWTGEKAPIDVMSTAVEKTLLRL